MAFFYTDITESGVRVWCGEDGVVHFGPGAEHEAPSYLHELRAVNIGETVIVIGKLHIGGQTYVCNSHGAHRILGANHGERAHGLCVLGPNAVRAVWVESAFWAWSARLDRVTLLDVEAPFKFDNPNGSSQGLLDVGPVSEIWTDFSRVQVIDGLQYGLPLTRGDWTVGQDYQGVNGFAVLAYHQPTRKHYVAWRGETKVAPRINAFGTVAVSGFGTPETLFRTPDQFEPALLKPEDPDQPDPEDPVIPSIDDVRAARERYPAATIDRHQSAEICNRVAYQYREVWGLLKKPEGKNHGVRPDGERIAVDILLRRSDFFILDILTSAGSVDGDGVARPQVGTPHADIYTEDDLVEPMAPYDLGEVDPDPPDEPDPDEPVDLKPILDALKSQRDEISALRATVQQLTQMVGKIGLDVIAAGAESTDAARKAEAAANKAATRPWPSMRGTLGYRISLDPDPKQ